MSKELSSQKINSSPTEASFFMLDKDALMRKMSCLSSEQQISNHELEFAHTNSKIAYEST